MDKTERCAVTLQFRSYAAHITSLKQPEPDSEYIWVFHNNQHYCHLKNCKLLMELTKYFKKATDRSYRRTIPKITDDDNMEKEKEYYYVVSVGKDCLWSLKIHLS